MHSPMESCRQCVRIEFLYGMWCLFPSASAVRTSESADKLKWGDVMSGRCGDGQRGVRVHRCVKRLCYTIAAQALRTETHTILRAYPWLCTIIHVLIRSIPTTLNLPLIDALCLSECRSCGTRCS